MRSKLFTFALFVIFLEVLFVNTRSTITYGSEKIKIQEEINLNTENIAKGTGFNGFNKKNNLLVSCPSAPFCQPPQGGFCFYPSASVCVIDEGSIVALVYSAKSGGKKGDTYIFNWYYPDGSLAFTWTYVQDVDYLCWIYTYIGNAPPVSMLSTHPGIWSVTLTYKGNPAVSLNFNVDVLQFQKIGGDGQVSALEEPLEKPLEVKLKGCGYSSAIFTITQWPKNARGMELQSPSTGQSGLSVESVSDASDIAYVTMTVGSEEGNYIIEAVPNATVPAIAKVTVDESHRTITQTPPTTTFTIIGKKLVINVTQMFSENDLILRIDPSDIFFGTHDVPFDENCYLRITKNTYRGDVINSQKNIDWKTNIILDACPSHIDPQKLNWECNWNIKGIGRGNIDGTGYSSAGIDGIPIQTTLHGPITSRDFGTHDMEFKFVFKKGNDRVNTQDINTTFKAFFWQEGDYDSDNIPNWFEYWGELTGTSDLVYGGLSQNYYQCLSFWALGYYDYDGCTGNLNKCVIFDEVTYANNTRCGLIKPGIDAFGQTVAHEHKHREQFFQGGYPDANRDGVPEYTRTLDRDGDWLSDSYENAHSLPPWNFDYEAVDSDGDGLRDLEEEPCIEMYVRWPDDSHNADDWSAPVGKQTSGYRISQFKTFLVGNTYTSEKDTSISEKSTVELLQLLKWYRLSREMRNATKKELVRRNNPVLVSALIKMLSDSLVIVRMDAVEMLGEMKSKEAFEPLVKLLENSNPTIYPPLVFIALNKIEPDKAAHLTHLVEPWLPDHYKPEGDPNLIDNINKAYCEARTYGLNLEKKIEGLITILKGPNSFTAIESIVKIGKPAVPSLIDVVKNRNNSDESRGRALLCLHRIGDNSYIPLSEKIASDATESTYFRLSCLSGLARTRNISSYLPWLEKVISDTTEPTYTRDYAKTIKETINRK